MRGAQRRGIRHEATTSRFRSDWRMKALVQQALSALPEGYRVNYWLQRHVSKRLPLSQVQLLATAEASARHLRAYLAYGQVPLCEATFFEFGAGWDMGNPIALYLLGVDRQIVVDLRPLARPELIDDLLERLPDFGALEAGRMREFADLAKAARQHPDAVGKLRHFGIEYRAPSDVRTTGLPPGSIDCVTSTAVLEHVPVIHIPSIFHELHRLLRSGGVASCEIDYHDHYCTFDSSITPYNFLRYSDRRWRIFNPSLNYQNRLRHSEYVAMARAEGFEVVEEGPGDVGLPQLAQLASVPLAREFRHLAASDVAITQSHLVLRKG